MARDIIKTFLIILLFAVVYLWMFSFEIDAAEHKGATYPLKAFSDPELEKELAAWEEKKRLHPDKWKGYIEFLGKPGTSRNIGQTDLLVPILQDENDLTYFNARGMFDDNDTEEMNFGFGHRHMFDKFILGAHFAFDKRWESRTFKQHTLGLEFLSESFDLRANGYIAESNLEIGATTRDLYSITANTTANKALSGYDAEIGYKLPLGKFSELTKDVRVYAGGYHFIGDDHFNSVSGPRFRLEARVHDLSFLGEGSRVMLGIESQHDDTRGTQTFGLASVRIPFSSIGDIFTGNKTVRKSPLTPLERRMQEPVVRDSDIVLGHTNVKHNVLNMDGEEYTKLVLLDSGTSIKEADERMQIEVAKGERPLLVHREDSKGTGLDFRANGRTKITGGYTYAMAGTDVKVQTVNPFTGERSWGVVKTLGQHAHVSGRQQDYFELYDDSHINGWDIDFNFVSDYGIRISTPGRNRISASNLRNTQREVIHINTHRRPTLDVETIITDSSISGSRGRNTIGVYGEGAQLKIYNSKVFGANLAGIHVGDGANAYLDDVEIYFNSGNGVHVDTDATATINNSEIRNNGGSGVFAEVRSKVYINGSDIHHNRGTGVASNTDSEIFIDDTDIHHNTGAGVLATAPPPRTPVTPSPSKIFITRSDIHNNGGSGVFAERGAEVFIDDSKIFSNRQNGVWATNNSKVEIDNSKIYWNLQNGVRANENSEARINWTEIYGNGSTSKFSSHHAGVSSSDTAKIWIDNSRIYENFSSGVSSDAGGWVDIRNSGVFGNGWHGLYAVDGSKIFAHNFWATKNWGSGVFAKSADSEISIFDSNIFENVEHGVWADLNSTININRSNISGNKKNGVYATYNSTVKIDRSNIYENDENGFSANFYSVAAGLKINIDNSYIYKNAKDGVVADGLALVNIDNTDIYENGLTGVFSQGAASIKILNSNIFGNLESGVKAHNRGWIHILHSDVFDNGLHGLEASENAEIIADDLSITDNAEHGVDVSTGSTVTINDSDISKNGLNGVRANSNSTVIINRSDIHNNGINGIDSTDRFARVRDWHSGIYSNDTARIIIDDSHIYENFSNGLSADNGGYIKIDNSFVEDNGLHGLNASEGGRIYADNLQILNNGGDGVDANGTQVGGSFIEIRNSTISGHVHGILANETSKAGASLNQVDAYNVTVSGNVNGVSAIEGLVNIYENSKILNNTVGLWAITEKPHFHTGTINISDSAVSGSRFEGAGSQSGEITITNSNFSGNRGGNYHNHYECLDVDPGDTDPDWGRFRTGKITVDGNPIPKSRNAVRLLECD